MERERLLIIGLDEPEYRELMARVDVLVVAYEFLPRLRLVRGELQVESRERAGRWLRVDRVIYHGIFADDFDVLTLLALWRGPCLPDAMGMVDMRLRHSGLARALRVSRYGADPRGMLLAGDTFDPAGAMFVAKWGNWHCGENKARFDSAWTAPDVAVLEPFFAGEAVRMVWIGKRAWQIRLAGVDWLKSIHHADAAEMPLNADLAADARAIADHFGLQVVGVDYMAGEGNTFHLLEVNHIPNVTVFPFMRAAFLDLAVEWVAN